MTTIKTFIVSSLLLFSLNSIVAQEGKEWSLEDCIDYAYNHNIQLQRQNNNLLIQQNNLEQSKNNKLPTVNGSGNFRSNYGRGLNGATNTYTNQNNYGGSYGIGASLDLFKGFEKKHRIKKNKFDMESIRYDIATQKEKIALNITSIYLDILYAREQLGVAKEDLEIMRKQQAQTKEMIDAGKKPKGDMLELQSEIAQKESNIVDAENKLTLSYLNLYQLLDIKEQNSFKIQTINTEQIDQLASKILNETIDTDEIIKNRPSILGFKSKKLSAEQDIKIAKSYYYPTLSLNASVGSSYSSMQYERNVSPTGGYIQGNRLSFGKQADVNLSESWGLSLNIPIFNKFQTRTNVINAQIRLKDIELQQTEQENQLYKELQQAYTNAKSAFKKYHAQKKSLVAHKETFRYITEKYKLGLVNNLDYNQALNNLTIAKSNMLQAKYQYIFRSKIIDFYNGKPLRF